MAKFKVTVDITYRKEITIYADDHEEAGEVAVDRCKGWDNVHDVELVDSEREQ